MKIQTICKAFDTEIVIKSNASTRSDLEKEFGENIKLI